MNAKQEAEKTLMHMRETNHGRYAIEMENLLKELEQVELNYKQLEKAHAKDILKLEATGRKLAKAEKVVETTRNLIDTSEMGMWLAANRDYEASKGVGDES